GGGGAKIHLWCRQGGSSARRFRGSGGARSPRVARASRRRCGCWPGHASRRRPCRFGARPCSRLTRAGRWCQKTPSCPSSLLFSTFSRRDPLPVTLRTLARLLVQIAPPGWWSIAQGLFNAGHVFAESSQNAFALSAAWHFGAKQLEDEWIGRLAKSPDRCVRSLSFQAPQASVIDKRLRILAYGSTTKFGNSVAGQAQND